MRSRTCGKAAVFAAIPAKSNTARAQSKAGVSSCETQTTLMTGPHVTTGTPAFMAPEIITNEGEVDQRADVYALGCVAY
jgi:serine/threonine protein kinase